MLPPVITKLSKLLTKIPSIGPKSAEKLALWFASNGLPYAKELGFVLSELPKQIGICSECGYFAESALCSFCSDNSRSQDILCLVEHNIDVIDIEESHVFRGRYFILGGVISPLEGITISDLPFDRLKEKILHEQIKEIIVAFGATTEADVTIMYLKELFQDCNIIVSVLGRGLAVGTPIHYAGKKSLVEAFRIREQLN
ncbi:MAG: recombination mediator RecR [Brevinema sp.]